MEWTSQLGIVAGMLLLLIGLLVLSGRLRIGGIWLGAGRAEAELVAVDRVSLGPHHAIHRVRCGDTELVLAVFSNGCSLLQSRPWPAAQHSIPHAAIEEEKKS